MSGALPANIDAIRLADQGARLAGTIPLQRLKRLRGYCQSDEGLVSVELAFSHDRQRSVRMIDGHVVATIEIHCQRCLGLMTLDLESTVELLVLAPGQGELEDAEGVLIAGDSISLDELVENELILSLPMIPAHPAGECTSNVTETGPPPKIEHGESEPGQGENASPFAKLVKLKRPDRE